MKESKKQKETEATIKDNELPEEEQQVEDITPETERESSDQIDKKMPIEDETLTEDVQSTQKAEYTIRYTGNAASYTVGAVRFHPNESHVVDPECAKAALSSGQFVEVD